MSVLNRQKEDESNLLISFQDGAVIRVSDPQGLVTMVHLAWNPLINKDTQLTKVMICTGAKSLEGKNLIQVAKMSICQESLTFSSWT